MRNKVQEVKNVISTDEALATAIGEMFQKFSTLMAKKRADWVELRNYIFATDTRSTANAANGWQNSTTIPKLCQIRDNLHANYMTALYPNDEFIQWEALDQQALNSDKANVVKMYVRNKLVLGKFRETLSKLVYDYIDTGNIIGTTEYVKEFYLDENGEEVISFIGPRIVRISPYDIVFNPTAPSFEDTPKIHRYITSMGELMEAAERYPADKEWIEATLTKLRNRRHTLSQYSSADIDKAMGYQVDGFGSMQEYLNSDSVEILEFEGSMYDSTTNTLLSKRNITVVDRAFVAQNIPMPSWIGASKYKHVGWRPRPDNLWAMGPLDNLVGMQYRIDHLENAKADAWDFTTNPVVAVKGNVEQFSGGR